MEKTALQRLYTPNNDRTTIVTVIGLTFFPECSVDAKTEKMFRQEHCFNLSFRVFKGKSSV